MNFGDKKVKKSDFYKNKKVIKIKKIDVNKILLSKEEPYGKKNYLNILLDIKLPQMIGYVDSFENNNVF